VPQTPHPLLVLLTLVAASAPTPAHAGGVVSACDEAHLLDALTSGGTVTFSCSGTIILTATITIAADTTIDGSGQSVTISGDHAVRVFTVNSWVTLNLDRLTIADGIIIGSGGGILNNGTLIVSHGTFTGNSAQYTIDGGAGGGIDNSGTLTMSNSTFHGNGASTFGGGIYNHSGMVTISDSVFSSNGATNTGGGIYNKLGAVSVSNSTFSDNTGGGIVNYQGTVAISNSTLTGNRAIAGGGMANGGTSTVSNSTFTGNSVGGGETGGSIANYDSGGAATTLKNTIVANSPAGGNCFGTITDGGGNLSYPDTTCPGINSDPKLGPLQNNLGPTLTMALLPGSAAIDTADDAICAAAPVNGLDQRGITRPQGPHCDIGAYEATLLPILPRAYLPLIMR